MDVVCIQKAPQPSKETISSMLDLLEPINIRSDERVIVKPNICFHRNSREMIVTDPALVAATIDLLKERTSHITVVESDNRSGSADDRVEKLGLSSLLEQLKVPFKNLSKERNLLFRKIGDTEFHIPELVTEADWVVNLPKLKTCVGTTVTLSLKNTFGLVSDKNKPSMHGVLDKILLEVNKLIRRQLIIVDGGIGMEGNGPLVGDPVQTGIFVAGTQPVSVDATCSRIMGFDPSQISHIKACAEDGLGTIDVGGVNVVGKAISEVAVRFAPPSFNPVSVARTVKSAAQLYLK